MSVFLHNLVVIAAYAATGIGGCALVSSFAAVADGSITGRRGLVLCAVGVFLLCVFFALAASGVAVTS